MEKIRIQVHHLKDSFLFQDLYIIVCACLIGFVKDPYAIAFVLPFIAYITMRKKYEIRIVMVVLLCMAFLKGWIFLYIYALIFSFYFLCIQIYSWRNDNSLKRLTIICIVTAIPYLMYLGSDFKVSLILMLYLSCNLINTQQDVIWVEKKLQIHKSIYASLLLGIAFILLQTNIKLDPIMLSQIIIFLIALICTPFDTLLSIILMLVIYPTYQIVPFSILFMLLSFVQKQKLLQFALCCFMIFFLDDSLTNIFFCLSMALFCLLYQDKWVPYLKTDENRSNVNQAVFEDLNLKLANYSAIFASLSSYYESFSNVEADMLANMSTALVYSSDELKKYSFYDHQKERVLKALEGYQYEVEHFMIHQNNKGEIYIELTLLNNDRNEITSTLIPLLEVILKCRFEIDEIKGRRLNKRTHRVVIHSAPEFQIDAYGDSAKNIYEKSGDCFSIFQFRQSVVCMISDGMGNGEKAANSSRLITNIFQRMIACGIKQDSCIRCINKLLQSDAYATLDVVSFDRMSGYAYISKSAACPTFLIRDEEVFEVNGSALPVGIVTSIKPDCFRVKLKAGDAYLMVSDGIYLNEIYEWIKIKKGKDARANIEAMMSILSKQDRVDDSTVLLAFVKKQ
ncbi:MAG: SpoIIE family protein phosphatase [Erysipelotrichaceae bacterium]